MSRWSGKCDFADHISGLGGWYDKDGNPVKFGQEGVGAYYSDELQDFREFKRKTGGVMYQHKRIKKIDECERKVIFKDQTAIPIDNIYEMDGEIFKNLC